MSQFNYSQYQNVVNRAQSAPSTNAVRVGFFKLKDGEDALVRINVSKLDDLKFATVHKTVFGKNQNILPPKALRPSWQTNCCLQQWTVES